MSGTSGETGKPGAGGTEAAKTENGAAGPKPPFHDGKPITQMDAAALREKLLADKDYVKDALSGDAKKANELAQLWQLERGEQPAASLPPETVADVAKQDLERAKLQRETVIDSIRKSAALPDDVADMIRNNTPVSATERHLAEQEKDRLIRDPEFRRKFLAGDREANTRFAVLGVILARPVAKEGTNAAA
jgi:hypothetical protein